MLGKISKRGGVAVAAAALVGMTIPGVAQADQHAVTSEVEKQRVDAVATPVLDWQPCEGEQYAGNLCASAKLPLDYDEPDGELIEVALLKVPAAKPEQRVGSLFINPGGPGGSGKKVAAMRDQMFSQQLLDRFDIIGMDPRGIADSTPLNCFSSPEEAKDFLAAEDMAYPTTPEEQETYLAGAADLAKACADNELAASMSTSQVARDMDVLRRAVGDEKLNYLGMSYGSYLGQAYANLFPDRFRALAIDGILNATEWVGTSDTAHLPLDVRITSAEGADRALNTFFERCAQAEDCPLEDPKAQFDAVRERLKQHPVSFPTHTGAVEHVTEPRFIGLIYALLSTATQVEGIADLVQIVEKLSSHEGRSTATTKALGHQFSALEQQAAQASEQTPVETPLDAAEEPENDSPDKQLAKLASYSAYAAVTCTDGSHPGPRAMRTAAASHSQQYPYFGESWLWIASAVCATWQPHDEDAHRGPFNQHTASPVLVVGNEHDPATNVSNAKEVADLLPNSQLLLSNNWGHIAYGKSQCATQAIDAYLIDPKKTSEPINCTDGTQPFN